MAFNYKPGSMIFMQDADYYYTIDTQKIFQISKAYEVWEMIAENSKEETVTPAHMIDRLVYPTTKQVVMPEIDHAVLNEKVGQEVARLINQHLYPSWSFGSVDTLVSNLTNMLRRTADNRGKFNALQSSVSNFNRRSLASTYRINDNVLFGLQASRDLSAAALLAVAVIPVSMLAGAGTAASLGAGSAINAVAAYQDNVFDSRGVMLPKGRRVGQALAVGGLSFTLAAFGGSSAALSLPGMLGRKLASEVVIVTLASAGGFGTSLYSGKDLVTATAAGLIPLSDPFFKKMVESRAISSLLNRTVVPALYRRAGTDPRVTLEVSRALLGSTMLSCAEN